MNLELIKSKIFSKKEMLDSWLPYWKFKGQKLVFTNGCFDIIHRGHVEYLAHAADKGDILIIGLNSDKSVRKIKGTSRPVLDELSRAMVLASLRFVDVVVLFHEETPYELIKYLQPDFLVKGSDYKPEDIVGADIVKANSGQVITIDFIEGYSTSEIINKLKS